MQASEKVSPSLFNRDVSGPVCLRGREVKGCATVHLGYDNGNSVMENNGKTRMRGTSWWKRADRLGRRWARTPELLLRSRMKCFHWLDRGRRGAHIFATASHALTRLIRGECL